MKHVIIGTAGHVDHGKTCLVKALAGMDTDRLKEEKRRGITIELGFAYVDFSNGQRAGIIDVPGHEKFVKHMLAGAGGIDVALLAVAADEGVMPQTREHLDILTVLGVKTGVIVLTKADLVEEEFLGLVKEDVRNLVKDTFLKQACILPVSAATGMGIRELKEILMKLCASVPERQDKGSFRLFVDRAFSVKGYGTVVTGTLLDGCLARNSSAVLYPQCLPVKIRGLQVHGEDRKKVFPGERAAVNLSDTRKEEIHRGEVLALAGSVVPAYVLDVKIQCLPHSGRKIANGMRAHVYHGSRELLGRVVLMDREILKPGEACYGQLRLEACTAARKGDRFVLRFYSPQETIGGGMVLDPCSVKKKRNDGKILETFRIKEKGSDKELLELAVLESWGKFPVLSEAAEKCGLFQKEAYKLAEELCRERVLFSLDKDRYIHKKELEYYQKQTEGFLQEFHKKFPLKEGMGLQEARNRLRISKSQRADAVLHLLEQRKVLREKGGYICKFDFYIKPEGEDAFLMEQILQDYECAGYAPLACSVYEKKYEGKKNFRRVFMRLLNTGALVRLNEQYCIGKKQYETAWNVFLSLAREQEMVITGEYRDRLCCSRKIAIAILENFDRKGLTRITDQGRLPGENKEIEKNRR